MDPEAVIGVEQSQPPEYIFTASNIIYCTTFAISTANYADPKLVSVEHQAETLQPLGDLAITETRQCAHQVPTISG